MSVEDFWGITPRSLSNIMEKYWDDAQERKEERWEIARMISYSAVSAFGGNKDSAEKIFPFPWDKKEQKVAKAKITKHASK